MITLNPAWTGFIKGILTIVVAVIVQYLSVASNLQGILPLGIATVVAGIFSMIESQVKANADGTKGLFGAVRVR